MTQQQTKQEIPPLVKTVTVHLSVEHAFRRFTEQMAAWWPLESHSVGQRDAESVTLEGRVGGRVFETLKGGDTSLWGTVQVWEPPHRVAFTWHPGREASTEQEVDVRFTDRNGETEVMLTHSGWEKLGAAAQEMREQYNAGWGVVLGKYAAS